MLEVAEHYYHFGGRSPINEQNRALIAALECELDAHGPALPIYWENRNWHPMLADTLGRMRADGIRRALVFATSAFGSYSGCRQYREDIERARMETGPGAPEIHKLRTFHDHPGFIHAMAGSGAGSPEPDPGRPARGGARSSSLRTAFPFPWPKRARTWHNSWSPAGLFPKPWAGRARWCTRAGAVRLCSPGSNRTSAIPSASCTRAGGLTDLVLAPIGFLSDHMEVVYDLDTEAAALCRELGVNLSRAATVGVHPAFVSMIRELILERTEGRERRCLGRATAGFDTCGPDCCPPPKRAPVRSAEAR